MKIAVDLDKMLTELLNPRERKGLARVEGKLTRLEVETLYYWLLGVEQRLIDNMLRRERNNGQSTVAMRMKIIRSTLNVKNAQELAYLCYERGYVTITEEERGTNSQGNVAVSARSSPTIRRQLPSEASGE